VSLQAQGKAVTGGTLRDLVCRKHNFDVSQFDNFVLDATLYPHALVVKRLLGPLVGLVFRPERLLARALGLCASLREINVEFCGHRATRKTAGFSLRRLLRLRISGERLMAFAAGYFDGSP
jgi:hypothetical protein